MYVPAAFRIDDAEKLAVFMEEYSFATLVTHDGDAPFASHLPMLFRKEGGPHGTLVSHMARANEQWCHFGNGREALAIFHGPHAYISPSWYQVQPAVPTWNYAVVHARGVPRLLEDETVVVSLLRETIAAFESPLPNPWKGDLPEEYLHRMIQGIVAFEIPLSQVEGKFKLGQNRSLEDQRGVHRGLTDSHGRDALALADLMRRERPGIT